MLVKTIKSEVYPFYLDQKFVKPTLRLQIEKCYFIDPHLKSDFKPQSRLYEFLVQIKVMDFSFDCLYLYWGFCKNDSPWLRQPPALLLFFSPFIQDPNSWDSFQVLAKENTDVLISLHIDNSVKLLKKSSNGILDTTK